MGHSDTQMWSFYDVDKTAEPGKLIDFLDRAFAIEGVKDLKRRTYELLDLKQGEKILDVGCGSGADVLALSQMTGTDGLAVGVDSSELMINEAKKRAAQTNSKTEFYVSESCNLRFFDREFDACRAERLFVHLTEPEKTLREMTRVVRSGGRVLSLEGDFETLIINHHDRRLTRRILNYLCDQVANGWIGRRLPSLFKAAHLTSIKVYPVNLTLCDFSAADGFWMLTENATSAAQHKIISAVEADNWLKDLNNLDESGNFFCNVTGFIVLGYKSNQT